MFLFQFALNAETLSLMVIGMLAPFITNYVKSKLGVDSLKAYALHLGVSAAVAVGAALATGEASPSTLLQNFTFIATLATTVFNVLKTKYPEAKPEE
jgi:hypothetical protein